MNKQLIYRLCKGAGLKDADVPEIVSFLSDLSTDLRLSRFDIMCPSSLYIIFKEALIHYTEEFFYTHKLDAKYCAEVNAAIYDLETRSKNASVIIPRLLSQANIGYVITVRPCISLWIDYVSSIRAKDPIAYITPGELIDYSFPWHEAKSGSDWLFNAARLNSFIGNLSLQNLLQNTPLLKDMSQKFL